MGTKNFLYIGTALAFLFSLSAIAGELSGKTADGCTYKVINGQYLASCPSRAAAPAAVAAARPTYVASNAAPVTSYGDVPVRSNGYAAPPSLPPQQPNQASAPVSSIERDSAYSAPSSSYEIEGRDRFKAKLLDQTYVGLQVGASNMKESNAGSTTGFGLDIGTNIDDTFGVELGYSYAKQGLNMGLSSRGSSVDPSLEQGSGFNTTARPTSDASLSTNLFTGELQAHLTDPVKRLRPYLGAGLGWRSATLSENASTGTQTVNSASGGSLRQSSFGGLAAAGTKLRLTKAVSLGFVFRYFFPIARQEARLEQPVASNYGASAPQTKLSGGDDTLTGSSQYQVLGGVQYAF